MPCVCDKTIFPARFVDLSHIQTIWRVLNQVNLEFEIPAINEDNNKISLDKNK